jgi:Methyltransferase domain
VPACVNCRKLEGHTCSAYDVAKTVFKRTLPPPPLGACMVPIVEDYMTLIRPGMRVLEVGCGDWAWIRDRCREVGADYEGIDVAPDSSVATRTANLADLSFEDETFDLVFATQSMEHWSEHGCSLRRGLHQCFRVSKPLGTIHLNVPIHFHGTSEFMLGRLGKITELMYAFSNTVDLEAWGRPSAPIPRCHPYPGYWRLVRRPAYVLDIRARRDKPLGSMPHNWALRGRAAQLTRYPISFNLYRGLRKAGAMPDAEWRQG